MAQSNPLLFVFLLIVAALSAVLLFAVLRLGLATRAANRRQRDAGSETAFLTTALEQAVARLRKQERATEERAVASERLSEQIIASLASGLLVVDVGGDVHILNPAGRRLLGLTRPAGGSFRELLAPVASPLTGALEQCLATRRPIGRRTLKLDAAAGPGRATHLGVSISPMLDDGGQLLGAICLFTDLSAVMELEERVRLQDSLARVGELTAGIAHEFRNGLATIHGYARLIDPGKLRADYKPYVEGIRQETVALREVVDNFLAFARPAELSLTTVSMAKLAERAADEVRGDVTRRGGAVVLSGEFADVEGDDVLLRQALSNLCRNAVDACADAQVAPQIRLIGTVDREHGEVRVTVTDNGPGIAADARERIFRPFFTTKSSGTGLGLALTQKIVVTHNGRVTAGTADSGGARMDIVLPLTPAT